MKILLHAGEGDFATQLALVRAAEPLPPFAPPLSQFVEALSARLLADSSLRAHPDLLALAHWFRPLALRGLRERLARAEVDGPLAARGVVFHVAPSNVDLVFAYPWLLGLLLGDSTVVRLSRRSGTSAALLLAAIDALVREPTHAAIRRRSLVVSYDPDAAVTGTIGRSADLRVLWGSDATIAELRAIPVPAYVRDVVFADRFSWAAISARALLVAGEGEIGALADRFVRDVFLFDQLACSSPRALAWVGTVDEVSSAKHRFWPAVDAALARRPRDSAEGAAIARLICACVLALDDPGARVTLSEHYARVEVASVDARARREHDGFGVVLEVSVGRPEALATMVSRVDQTLAHHGFSEDELAALVRATRGRGIDRFVPIGEALTFDVVWDGEDLVRALTRPAVVRG